MPDYTTAAQAAMQNPISEAISILTADAASIRESHTPPCDRDDWSSDPETKAYYDHLRRVASELSKLRAPVDPEAAEVDFLACVLENLDTWRAEDWSELLERRPAILAMLRPMVLASAPVAGEAQPVCWIDRTQLENVRDEGEDAWVYWRGTGHAAEPDEVPLYAAPQASEAVR